MKKIVFYMILLLCLYSCKKTDYIHQTFKAYPIFLEEQYDLSKNSIIQLNNNTEISDINFSISGLFGNINITNLFVDDKINLNDLPKSILDVAGIYTILASHNSKIIDKTLLRIPSGQIHGKSTNYIGPKTTSFDDRIGSLITGYFQDSLNNLVDTTLNLQYKLQIDAALKVQNINTDHQYYFTHKVKPRNSKRQLIGIKAGDQYSNEMTVLGSSGCPITSEINIYNRYNIADGRQIFTVELDGFFDEDREQIANGTSISLLFKSNNFKSSYDGQIINGQVRFSVQNPHLAGTYYLEARSCGELIAKSKGLYFKQSVKDIDYSVLGSIVKIGPVLSVLNQTIPNGTPVRISSNACPNTKQIHLELEEGYASFDLSELDNTCTSENYKILINGVGQDLIIKAQLDQ